MKNIWNKYKWILLLLINALPFGLGVIFYSAGTPADLVLFLPVFTGLTVLNYKKCHKVVPYVLYQVFILICIIGAGYASTYLYYHNVSNDFMTLIVGAFMVLLESSISIVATAITAVIKGVKDKRCRE